MMLSPTRFRCFYSLGLCAFAMLFLGLGRQVSRADSTTVNGQGKPVYVGRVRNLETDRMGILNPAGLAFSPKANTFQIISKRQAQANGVDLLQLSPQESKSTSRRLAAQIEDPLNLTFDGKRNRLLFLRNNARQLIEVATDSAGIPELNSVRLIKIKSFGLQTPQGMTIDPASGVLYILDATGPRLVQVTPDTSGNFENARLVTVNLQPTGLVNPRGLAWYPPSGTLYLFSPTSQLLTEITPDGQVVSTRDLTAFGLRDSQTLVFAPSGDLTDDPAELSLYIADAGQLGMVRSAESTSTLCDTAEACANHLYLPLIDNSTENAIITEDVNASASTAQAGTIVELTLVAPAVAPAAAFTAAVVRTVDLATISPPSPDPSGLAYLPNSNTLLLSDGEVDETVSGITHFQGANIWELTLGGSVVRTANISKVAPTVVRMTNEPPGAAWNPNNGHYYFSDDDARRVYDLNPGADGWIGTADDTWTSFDTLAVGSVDPEGITIDSVNNQIFIADGTNIEIYQFSLTGTLLNHFDVEQFGVLDPESVEYNPDSGTLLVLSNHTSPRIAEVTTSGALLRMIDLTAANAYAPAGLAYAPASDGSGAKRYYLVDRRIDNNVDPVIIDGRLLELTAPAPLPAGNSQPTVNAGPDQTIALPATLFLDGTASDDGQPIPPGALTTTWSQLSGPGTVLFANAQAVDTTAGFTLPGVYLLRLSAFDGALTTVDDLTVTVTGSNNVASLDVRITASADDAEENGTNNTMNLTSSDLDLLLDTGGSPPVTNLAVGLRFPGITVPPGATIVNAFVQFTVDEVQSTATQLTIQGHAIDTAPTFTSSRRSISNRPLTTAAVSWTPVLWTTIGQSGPDQRTSNLAPIIQELISRPGWVTGNAIALILTGSGQRVAIAFEGAAGAAPLLHIEYTVPSPTATPAETPLPTATETLLPTATETPQPTATANATETPTAAPTDSPVPPTTTETETSTATPSDTPEPTATATAMPTDTAMPTATMTDIPTVAATATPSATAIPTDTPVPSPIPTDTPLPTATATAVPAATATETPTDTPVPPTATDTPLPTVTLTDTPIPTATPLSPTATATTTDTPVPPTATATQLPTATATAVPPTATPTHTPIPDLIFADGFESGNLSAWSSSQTSGSNLSVASTAALQGLQGLRVQISSNSLIYVVDESPAAEVRYRARFYFAPNSITMAEGDAHYLLVGYDAVTTTPKLVLYVELRFTAGSYQIRLRQNDDSQTTRSTNWFTISNASHAIELDWSAATAVNANNGYLTLWIDGLQRATVTGLDNDTRRIDRIRLGVAGDLDTGTRGTYAIDAFESRRQSYIGP